MHIVRIKETCIYVNDLEKTKRFYVDKIGLEMISIVANRHIFFKAGESVLLCFIAAQTQQENELPPHGAAGSVHFAFEVTKKDYAEAFKKVKAADIPIIHEHTWKGGICSFYFHDPDHNLIEVIEEGLWDDADLTQDITDD